MPKHSDKEEDQLLCRLRENKHGMWNEKREIEETGCSKMGRVYKEWQAEQKRVI